VILDHIYVAGAVEVLLHAVEPARVDGHFPSDHMPLIADLLFPKQKSE
jgi:endonuclease/exonuclease/phosphatase family metal-dependent hydrolase